MAPQISMACFSRIRRAIDAPIGPTPYWMARIFFFKAFSVFQFAVGETSCLFGGKRKPNDKGIWERRQRKMPPPRLAEEFSFRRYFCPGKIEGSSREVIA